MTAHLSTDLLRSERLTFAETQRRRAELHGLPIDRQPHISLPEQTRPSPPAAQPLRDTASPGLPVAALHGYAGLAVRTIAPHTEAHPASILLQLLAAFGNMVGPGPHCMVDTTRHGLNLFLVLVGDSSKARKGTSWSQIARLLAEVDQPWLSNCVTGARLTAGGLSIPFAISSRPPIAGSSPSLKSLPPSSGRSSPATATYPPCFVALGIVVISRRSI
jgi:hypothetical protein